MGIKSTIEITREAAIERATNCKKEILRRKTEAKYYAMSDKELHSTLDDAGLSRNTDLEEDRLKAVKDLGEWDLDRQTRQFGAEFYAMSDEELEDEVERLNDASSPSGYGFYNYTITPNPEPSMW